MAPKSESKKTTVAAPAEKKTSTKVDKKSESKKSEKKAPSKKTEKPVAEKKAPSKKTESDAPAEKKERRVITKESLSTDFESVVTSINEEIERLREAKPKAKGIKFLKTLNKAIKQLHNDANRVTKFKKQSTRKANTSSGFLKPVNISGELAKFTGWDVNNTYSRTEVTKFICEYVKSNKLFDSSEEGDKRNILVDEKLKTLLKYDPKNPPKDAEGKSLPLTYFRLQQYLKHHFIKPTAEEEELDE
jgi:chromatin remodeling complex protein RSC6